MQLPVLIEPLEGGRFRARTGELFLVCAEGESVAQATDALVKALKKQLSNGSQLILVDIPTGLSAPSSLPLPGDELYKTDWVYRELQEAIAENRRLEESAES